MIIPSKKDGKKRQAYPSSKIKIGGVLYSISVDDWDDGTTTISVNEWVIRSIRRKRGTQTRIGKLRRGTAFGDTAPYYVNATNKLKDITWVRQSRKVADFGWSKSISPHLKVQFKVGDHLPSGMYTTPLAAFKWKLKDKELSLEMCLKWQEEESEDEKAAWNDEIKTAEKGIRLLKTRIKKISAKK